MRIKRQLCDGAAIWEAVVAREPRILKAQAPSSVATAFVAAATEAKQ